MDVKQLQHKQKDLENGGVVLVLNTGATITPEAEAMLQALHSRSIGGIKSHLEVLASKGPEKFMSTFYVGYGHKSIGDCGTCTLFIEGISMLAAKAIQDWPLYSGQEASTRYIDFAKQNFIDPVGTSKSKAILEKWREIYMEGLVVMQNELTQRFPIQEGETEAIYKKAINARAFDTMRSFLPSGASTNIAWHTNLRQAADHLLRLRHHPLAEVRDIAETAEEVLRETFPSSFGHTRYETTENFNQEWMKDFYYYTESKPAEFELTKNNVDRKALKNFGQILKSRPAKTEMPKEVAECGNLQFEFLLDFGSFRDIQRHRAVNQRMPLVVMDHGFGEWYLSELPEEFRQKALRVLEEQKEAILGLEASKEISQYYIPMGYKLPNKVTGSIPAFVYLVELRSTRFVHPTLRKRAIQMAETLKKEFAEEGLLIHLDPDPDRFDIKRGEHDIVAKN